MFREMRRKDRVMLEEDTKTLLENAPFGILSTVSKSNTPYGVPMSFVYTDEVIYLHCALEGHKLDNISNCDSVCFNVIDAVELMPAVFSTKYKSAIIFGKIIIVKDLEEKRQGLKAILKKYSPEFYEAGLRYIDNAFEKTEVLKIEIRLITGKARL